MSNVAKFLIIVNLLLAGVFVGSAANFLGQKDHVQQQLEQARDDFKTKWADAKAAADSFQAKVNALSAENTTLKETAGKAEQAKSDADQKAAALATRLDTADKNLISATRGIESMTQQAGVMQEQIKNLQAQVGTLKESRDTENKARVAAEAMSATLQRQYDDEVAARKGTEGALADANRKNETLEAELGYYRSAFPNAKPGTAQPAITPGKVLAADNATGLVIVSFGEEDGVKVGYEYIISRGNQYVATVKVSDVQAKKATAMVERGMQKSPITPGDTVANR